MSPKPTTLLARSEEGRWLGGVCAGLARSRGGVAWIRLAFLAAAACAGLGVIVYAACWLILPAGSDAASQAQPNRLVGVAQAGAACAGLVVVGVLGTVLTVFGLGWVALALAGTALVAALALRPGRGTVWALLPVAALTLPPIAVASEGLRLTPSVAPLVVAPGTLGAGSRLTVYAGLGTTLVDLRRTALPAAGGVATLRIHGGLRRTIIALPHDRCVRVDFESQLHPFLAQLAGQLTGEESFSGLDLFGGAGLPRPPSGDPTSSADPTLHIEFTSAGGSVYVRDYPTWVDPDTNPDWPGYSVSVERRPDTRGVPRRAARRLIAAWRVRRSAELASKRYVAQLMPGPCRRGAA